MSIPEHYDGWKKSSYSNTGNGCVEVGAAPGRRAVRDTKLGTASPMLSFSLEHWRRFAAYTKQGECAAYGNGQHIR